MNIDFETYSECDIKNGSFRYAQDPSTEIICMAYSFGTEIKLWLPGEKPPVEILEYTGEISAWNAGFEYAVWNNVLVKHGFPTLLVERFTCTMTDALALSLPASLDACAKALGLTQEKDSRGKRLITLLSKPRKPTKNKPHTRNTIEIEPELYQEMYEYCRQDVRVEMDIAARLPRRLRSQEKDLYHLTMKINERGLPIEKDLVDAVLDARVSYVERKNNRIYELTNGQLTNTNSRPKSLTWLKENGCELSGYTKSDLTTALKRTDLSDDVREFIETRFELGRTPIKKYDFLQNAMCDDQTVKNNLIFHKATTGRYCLTSDTEVLTQHGWALYHECTTPIAVWDSTNGGIHFENTTFHVWPVDGDMIHIKNRSVDLIVTPEHKIPFYASTDKFMCIEARDVLGRGLNKLILSTCVESNERDLMTRVIVMTQADGCFQYNRNDKSLRFTFIKERKINRCRNLLKKAEIVFKETTYSSGKSTIRVSWGDLPKWLSDFNEKDFSMFAFNDLNLYSFIEEVSFWDGYKTPGVESFEYSTCNKNNAFFCATAAHLTGHAARVVSRERNENWNTNYRVFVRPTKYTRVTPQHSKKTQYSGDVFCPETSTGFFLVRRKGLISITGNSGVGFQMQNLPRDSAENTEELINKFLTKNTDDLDVIDSGIKLIRNVITAPEGKKLVVSDFSGIENRVLAWVCGDEKTLDDFRKGVDQYKKTASGIFNVTYDQVTKDQRQLGKIAVLSCGYCGGPNALIPVALNYGVTLTEKQAKSIVDGYRAVNPKIKNFWYGLNDTAIQATVSGRTTQYREIRFRVLGDFLYMRLPNGRLIAYYKPVVQNVLTPWGAMKPALTFMGTNTYTRKWERCTATPGKLTENVVQSIARDFLTESMLKIEKAGYDIIGCVHDEIISLVDSDFGSIQEFDEIMKITPNWAKDCPIEVEGFEGKRYKK